MGERASSKAFSHPMGAASALAAGPIYTEGRQRDGPCVLRAQPLGYLAPAVASSFCCFAWAMIFSATCGGTCSY